MSDFQLLKSATDSEIFESLRNHLRPGRFWRLSSRPGTLAGAFLQGLSPSINELRSLLNRAFLAMIPGLSNQTLASWETLAGIRTAAKPLTISQRKALLGFWLWGRHGAVDQTIEELATCLGGTIVWEAPYAPLCVGSDAYPEGSISVSFDDDPTGQGSLGFDDDCYVVRGTLYGFDADSLAAFDALYPQLSQGHLKYEFAIGL